MVVDDQEANVRLLELILRRNGFKHITGITDARAAVETFATLAPDLLLLDLRMPHLDGFAVLEQVRGQRDGDLGDVPIVVLTADVDTAAKTRALALGADDLLTKPFDARYVAVLVRSLVEKRLLHRASHAP